MRIDYIVCLDNIADKLASKHRMTVREARQVLLNTPRIRFAEKGPIEDNDVYAAFGQTFAGRYVVVFFVYKPDTATAIIIDVEFQITCAVPIEVDLLSALEQQARLHRVQVETLINLWLQQKLAEQRPQQSVTT